MKTHELKTWPAFFEAMLSGAKTFEARKDDRGFKVGNRLRLREWAPRDSIHSALGDYSGRELLVEVTYVLRGSLDNRKTGIAEGYCVMGIRKIA